MTINRSIQDKTATLTLSGRLDTTTAPELEKALTDTMGEGIDTLILDLADLEYTSSAGLRVLLKGHKDMSRRGGMKLINVKEEVMEVLDITGFVDILTIE